MKRGDFNQASSQLAAILLGTVGLSTPNISPILLGSAADRLGFGFEQIGTFMGVEVLGVSLSAAFAVIWIHRVNWRKMAAAALVVCVVGNLLSAAVTEFGTFVAVRGFIGLFGEGVAFAIGVAALGKARNSDRAFAFLVAAQVVLAVVGLVAFPYLEASWGVAGITVPTAIFIAVTAPAILWLPPTLGRELRAASSAEARTQAVYWGLAAQFVWYFGVVSLYAFAERIGVAAGFEKTDIGLILALGMASSLVGSAAASVQGDRYSRVLPFVATMAIQSVFALLLVDLETEWTFALVWFAVNAAWNYGLPYIYAGISAADGSGRFVVMAPAAQGFGGALGTAVAGFLVASMGLSAVVYLSVAANLAAACLFVRCVRLTPEVS